MGHNDGCLEFASQNSSSITQSEDGGAVLQGGFGREETWEAVKENSKTKVRQKR